MNRIVFAIYKAKNVQVELTGDLTFAITRKFHNICIRNVSYIIGLCLRMRILDYKVKKKFGTLNSDANIASTGTELLHTKVKYCLLYQ